MSQLENKPVRSTTPTMPKPTEPSNTSSSGDEYFVRGVLHNQISVLWHHGEAYIKRALDHANGEFDHLQIRKLCEDRAVQLWLIATKKRVVGAATTEIVNYQNKTVIRVITLAGKDFDKWGHQFNDILESWGKTMQCSGIEAYVRCGFTKKLADYGFKKKYEMCYRELGD